MYSGVHCSAVLVYVHGSSHRFLGQPHPKVDCGFFFGWATHTRTTLYFVGYYIIDHYTQAEATKLSYLELVIKIVSWNPIVAWKAEEKIKKVKIEIELPI